METMGQMTSAAQSRQKKEKPQTGFRVQGLGFRD